MAHWRRARICDRGTVNHAISNSLPTRRTPEWKSDPRFARKSTHRQLDALMEGTGGDENALRPILQDILMRPVFRVALSSPGGSDSRSQSRHAAPMTEAEDGAGRFMVPNPPFQFAMARQDRRQVLCCEHTRGCSKASWAWNPAR